MKKILFLFLILFIGITVGCKKSNSVDKKEEEKNQSKKSDLVSPPPSLNAAIQKGINFIEKRQKPYGEIPSYMCRDELFKNCFEDSSVFVSTSLFEGQGLVLCEAMACKKPVIGPDVDGIKDVIDNEMNGYLVPPKNEKKLASKIVKILQDRKLAQRLGENGYKKAISEYNWKNIARKLYSVYQETLTSKI